METKRLKVMVGVNTLSVLDQAVYANHCQFWFRLGRSYSDIDFAFYTPRRSSIDRMRNELAKLAIAHDFDYILFLDDDVLVPIDGLAKLVHAQADIAAGWTVIRGWPFDNMFFKYEDPDTRKSLRKYTDPIIEEDGTIKCDAVGFSFCLLKVELLKKVPPPFFVTGPYNTEDVYFCIKARVHVPDATIIVHSGVKTGHCVGSEFITPDNRDSFKAYQKDNYPGMCQDEVIPLVARGDGYLAMVEDPTNVEKQEAHLTVGE